MTQRRMEGLPRCFPQDLFDQIDAWYGTQPAITPPHRRDLLSDGDSVFNTPPNSSDGTHDGDGTPRDFVEEPELFQTA